MTRTAKLHAARHSTLLRTAAMAVAALFAASAVVGCGSSSPSASGSTATTPGPTATPTAAPTPPPTLGTALSPVNPGGWPIAIQTDFLSEVQVGPDGTLYVAGLMPVDATGHGRVGWLALPDGSYVTPAVFGPDGSAFGELDGQVWAFDPDGKARTGWPLDVAASGWAISPGGKLYLMQWPTEGVTDVTIMDDHAAPVSSWSVPKVLDYSCDYLIQPDGTFWLTYPVADPSWWGACEIHAFGTDGKELSTGAIEDRWSGMSTGSNGVVAAWYYDFDEDSQERPARTRVAILGRDGRPLAGWPVTLEGAASPPAYGSDGSLYFTLLNSPANQVVALDEAGKVKPGWPVALAGDPLTVAAVGTEPLIPQSPIVGGSAVYVATQTEVDAFDGAGKMLDGWPYTLPAAWDDSRCTSSAETPVWNTGPVFGSDGSGSGRLYLGLDDRIVALTPGGAEATGWPYSGGSDFVCWRQLEPAPDGGLVAVGYHRIEGIPEHLIVRLTPEGSYPE